MRLRTIMILESHCTFSRKSQLPQKHSINTKTTAADCVGSTETSTIASGITFYFESFLKAGENFNSACKLMQYLDYQYQILW